MARQAVTPRPPREVFPIHKAARAVLHVYRGANVIDACRASGIPWTTWKQWLQPASSWPQGETRSYQAQVFSARLSHAFTRAQGLCGLAAQRNIFASSKMKVGERDWRASHEWLKHSEATRTRWHEHRELHIDQHTQVDWSVSRRVDQLPMGDVLELAGPEFAELVPADTAETHDQAEGRSG